MKLKWMMVFVIAVTLSICVTIRLYFPTPSGHDGYQRQMFYFWQKQKPNHSSVNFFKLGESHAGPFNCIVIGGMSFIGSRIAASLTKRSLINCANIIPIEDSINIEPDVMRWYRWTQLTTQLNLPTTLIDFEMDINKLIRIIKGNSNNYIFYIPTGISSQLSTFNDAKLLQVRSETEINFNKLLNIVLKNSDSVNGFALFSFGDENDHLQNTYLSTLEQSFLSFHYENSMNNTVVLVQGSTNGLYGPWQDSLSSSTSNTYCRYIDDLIHTVLHTIKTPINNPIINNFRDGQCQGYNRQNKRLTESWIEQYKTSLENQTLNIINGAALHIKKTKGHHYSSNLFKDNAKYIKDFVITALHYPSVQVRIFHNDFPKQFVEAFERYCQGRCKFIYHSRINDRVVVDQRFYMVYDYLLHHPEIKSIISGDIRDVSFHEDPFEVMSKLGDMFYASFDLAVKPNLRSMVWVVKLFKRCFPNYRYLNDILDEWGFFNSGVLGGTRHVMLCILARETLYLDASDDKAICDMSSAHITFHRYYYEQSFAGYPFNGAFALGIPGPRGAAIKHKYYGRHNVALDKE